MKIKNWPFTILWGILALIFLTLAFIQSGRLIDNNSESLFWTCLVLAAICIVALLYTNSDFK